MDLAYLEAVVNAVPKGGLSWTYTHFTDQESLFLISNPRPGTTVINVSADTMLEAVTLLGQGFPTVVSTPAANEAKVETFVGHLGQTVRVVRCPAEYNEKVTCRNCGNGKPLCARGDRDYIVKFTAHGSAAKKVGTEEKGGCYGSGGPVAIHWKKTMTATQELNDAEKLSAWVETLPYGTFLRHHIVGDLGLAT